MSTYSLTHFNSFIIHVSTDDYDVVKDNKNEILNIIKKCVPQVVGSENATLVATSQSIKIVGNSKLYDFAIMVILWKNFLKNINK